MSGNVATLAGGAAGAFIGSFFGMPGLGFSIGSGLAGMAFAPKPKGNSVDPGDLSFDTSAYGKFQRWGYGTYLVQGPVTFWSTDYVAHKHTEKVGGKGGGAGKQKVETITYTRSFAVYLADCTNGTPIVGVRRIWDAISGQMLYDVGEGADAATLIASQQMAKAVRIYTGALDQQPDPLIEAHEGWAPAWRGHAYVVFEDWDHGGSKQAPVLSMEVVSNGVQSWPNRINTWTRYSSSMNFDDGVLNFSKYGSVSDGIATKHLAKYTLDGQLIEAQTQSVPTIGGGNLFEVYQCLNRPNIDAARRPQQGDADASAWYVNGVQVAFPIKPPIGDSTYHAVDGRPIYWGGYAYLPGWSSAGGQHWVARYPADNGSPIGNPDRYYELPAQVWLAVDEFGYIYTYSNNTLYRFDAELTLLNTWSPVSMTGSTYTVTKGYLVAQSDASTVAVYTLPDGGGPLTQAGSITATGGVLTITFGMVMAGDGVISLQDMITVNADPLPAVIADLCARAGLETADYDTSLLASTGARLHIDRLRPARDWLTELGNLYRFRVRNSGGTLQFVPKGGSPVVTINQADLGLDVGEGSRPPITASRTQGIDLPRSLTVVYSDADNDYAPGQQQYVMRQYPQGQDITLTVTAILTGAEALELAQIAAKEPHLERLSWTTSVGIEYLSLEAGDVVDLPTGRAWVRDIQEQGDSVLRATFVAEAAAAYSGNGLPAPATTAPVRSIALAGPTRLELLDIPILQDADDGPGIYLAALGYLSGWSGAEVYRSDDGEVFDQLASVVTAAVVGTTTAALASGPVNIWDRANTLNVTLIDGSLSSASELNVLNGANAALVGAHGRWEIIQFETATLEADGSYTLSKLLRGRKGTEWAVGTHQAGDTFILLTSNTLGRVDKSVNDIGVTRNYKAVSFGSDIAQAPVTSFANHGVGLKPYAASHVTGSRNGSGDLTVKWIRRTRVGGEWRDYVDASLGEDSESYEVDVMSGSTVVRTLAVTSPTATYTAADQTTDFGSTQSSITLRVYQLSADIGRGYQTEKTL